MYSNFSSRYCLIFNEIRSRVFYENYILGSEIVTMNPLYKFVMLTV